MHTVLIKFYKILTRRGYKEISLEITRTAGARLQLQSHSVFHRNQPEEFYKRAWTLHSLPTAAPLRGLISSE